MIDKVHHLLTVEYSLVHAVTQAHMQAVKDIRAEVFVKRLEMSIEELEARNFLINQDDQQSFIYLLQHNETQKYVGTVRIIFVNEHTPVQTIPIQRDCHVKGIEHLTSDLPVCEISRLSLVKTLPEHKEYSMSQLGTLLSMALMNAIRINLCLYHYSSIFAVMERSLHRILKRQSVDFKLIGEAIDYYGVRFPYVMQKENYMIAGEKTEDTMGKLTKYYLQELCKNPEAFWEFIDNHPYLERSEIQLDKICKLFKEHGDDVSMVDLLSIDATSQTI